MIVELLSIAVLISGIIAIIFRQKENIKVYSVFKPLTTVLIIMIALWVSYKFSSNYSTVIIASLIFCLLGDIFLINKKYFLYGLSFFLFAHIGFTIAFSNIYGFNWNIFPAVILLLIICSYFLFLKKHLKISPRIYIYM